MTLLSSDSFNVRLLFLLFVRFHFTLCICKFVDLLVVFRLQVFDAAVLQSC